MIIKKVNIHVYYSKTNNVRSIDWCDHTGQLFITDDGDILDLTDHIKDLHKDGS